MTEGTAPAALASTQRSTAQPRVGHRRPGWWRPLLRGAGEILITAGVIVLLFLVYELFWTGIYTAHEQKLLEQRLLQEWRQPAAATAFPFQSVPLGAPVAILYIPRLGRNYLKVIVQGVGPDQLAMGPGHYPGTAWPGQIGDFVVSGHRTTHGAPFNRIDQLRRHDAIVVETRNFWFVYYVTYTEVVLPTDMAVIAPVPDHPGRRPALAYITLTTCNPKYSAAQRLIVHGVLGAVQPASAGRPAALTG